MYKSYSMLINLLKENFHRIIVRLVYIMLLNLPIILSLQQFHLLFPFLFLLVSFILPLNQQIKLLTIIYTLNYIVIID